MKWIFCCLPNLEKGNPNSGRQHFPCEKTDFQKVSPLLPITFSFHKIFQVQPKISWIIASFTQSFLQVCCGYLHLRQYKTPKLGENHENLEENITFFSSLLLRTWNNDFCVFWRKQSFWDEHFGKMMHFPNFGLRIKMRPTNQPEKCFQGVLRTVFPRQLAQILRAPFFSALMINPTELGYILIPNPDWFQCSKDSALIL